MFNHLTAVEDYPEYLEALFKSCDLKVGKNTLSDLSKKTKSFKHCTDYVVLPSFASNIPVSVSFHCLGKALKGVDFNLQCMSSIEIPECDKSAFEINEIGLIVTEFVPNDGGSCKSIITKAPQELWISTANINLFLATNTSLCVNEFGPNSYAILLGDSLRKGDKFLVGYSDGISTFYVVRGAHMSEASIHALVPKRIDLAS